MCAEDLKKKELLKKIAAMPFHAAEVRASMPTSRKKLVAQRSVHCSASPSRVRLSISQFNHGPLAGSQQ
jgi:hypothetical protein